MLRHIRITSVVMLLTAAASLTASAQTVTGQVREIGFGRVVRDATITLLDTLDAQLSSVYVDSIGAFSLRAPGPGRYRLMLRRGEVYSIRTAAFDLAAEQVRRFNLEVPLPPVELPAVQARAEAVPSVALMGFEQRVKSGFGTFLTREKLAEAGSPTRLQELLRAVNGVHVLGGGDHRYWVEMTRTGCPAKLVVNGVTWIRAPLKPGDNDVIREFLDFRAGDIEGVEIYKGASEVPSLFTGADAQCGVVAVWLRRDPGRDPGRLP